MSFSSVESIQDYSFKTVEEVTQAINDLKAMYEAGNIKAYTYENTLSLLKAKLKSLQNK